jgi:CTP synthase (UTP-ammonia lyase)
LALSSRDGDDEDMLSSRTARVALVGDRSPSVRSHTRIPKLLDVLRQAEGVALDAYWISTSDAAETRLDEFDGVWLLPGSPYASEDGAIAAVRAAREHGIPFLGTCGGFQHALVEYARHVCGIESASHAEQTPDGEESVIVPLACSLVGHEGAIDVTPGSMAERILGVERTVERYHCAYGVNPAYVETLAANGLRFTGHDEAGEVRIAELPGHPFYLATLFQPELAGDGSRCHVIVRAFAEAAVNSVNPVHSMNSSRGMSAPPAPAMGSGRRGSPEAALPPRPG